MPPPSDPTLKPSGPEDRQILLAIEAIFVSSALIGALPHRRWLNFSRRPAAVAGLIAGALSGLSLVGVVLGSTYAIPWFVRSFFSSAVITAIVWPALIMHLVIVSVRRRGMREESTSES